MTGAARSPTVAAPPAPASRRRRWIVRILSALGILGVAAWGIFTWLFFNPFEGRVERLDRVIPASVAYAFRGSVDRILAAPLVRERILARTEVADLLRTANVEETLRSVAQEQERLNARIPGWIGGFDLRRDLLGGETVAFGTADGMACATRLTTKARMALSLLKHEWARRRVEQGGGPKITRFPLIYGIDLSATAADPAWATAWAALVKDVLIVGNDQRLVQDAAHLASTGGAGSLPDLGKEKTVFSSDSGVPLRGWIDLESAGGVRACASSLEGPASFAAALLDLDGVSSVQAAASFPSKDQALLEVSGIRSGSAGGIPGALADMAARPVPEMLKEAALLAPAGSAVFAARLEVRVGALLQAAYMRFEAPVKEEIQKSLAEEKTSMEEICREVDDHLQAGVSVVVERLPECDDLPLDRMGANEAGEYVLPVPGVLLVFRQKASAGEGSAERFFRRWMEGWKERLESYEDLTGLPEGVRGFRFRPKFLTADKALWKPAAAFEGDLVFLSLNEGTLRRALEARAGKRPALTDFEGFAAAMERCGEGQVAAFVEVGAALKMRRDERREWATRRVEINWETKRREIFAQVARDFNANQRVITQKEIEAEVDRRVAEEERIQKEVLFPRAQEEFARGLKALEDLRSAAGCGTFDSSGFHLVLSLDAGR